VDACPWTLTRPNMINEREQDKMMDEAQIREVGPDPRILECSESMLPDVGAIIKYILVTLQ
jgi:hypothetical protein